MIKIAPSVLSANFSDMKQAVYDIEYSSAEYVHLDVMDGSFVPEITFGSKLVNDIRPLSSKVFDVHLMVNRPENHIDSFAKAGADIITIHQESTIHIHRVLQMIKSRNLKCGISIVPSTPVCMITPILEMVDLVLVMTVNPGYGGQKLIQSCLDKVIELKEIREREDYSYEISVDGGINLATVQDAAAAGIDVAVAGSAFFSASDKNTFVESMKRLAQEAVS
ncbi:MAG: ribulose-phosphate 3-epimerase [Sphaerochaetaceae bacterium]|nr:ribulose-phosphate 3-epimerase [Sphaerochaetaceae bacterium]